VSFTLAVNRDFAPKDGERATDFIDCVAWRHSAEFLSKYFSKGKMAVVEGRLQVRTWKDKDGNNRRNTEIVAENIYFGEGKKSDSSGFQPAQQEADRPEQAAPEPHYEQLDIDDGDLPF